MYVNHIYNQIILLQRCFCPSVYMSRFSESSIILFDCIGMLSSTLILDKKI